MTHVHRRRLAAAAALLALVATTSVRAMAGGFAAADADHDGKVTLPEFQAYATRMLAAGTGPVARRFQQLSPGQQAKRLQQRFDKVDSNHKGYLTPEDWDKS